MKAFPECGGAPTGSACPPTPGPPHSPGPSIRPGLVRRQQSGDLITSIDPPCHGSQSYYPGQASNPRFRLHSGTLDVGTKRSLPVPDLVESSAPVEWECGLPITDLDTEAYGDLPRPWKGPAAEAWFKPAPATCYGW